MRTRGPLVKQDHGLLLEVFACKCLRKHNSLCQGSQSKYEQQSLELVIDIPSDERPHCEALFQIETLTKTILSGQISCLIICGREKESAPPNGRIWLFLKPQKTPLCPRRLPFR